MANEVPSALVAQYALPLEEQKKLIGIPSNAKPTNATVQYAVELAKSAGIPLWGINILPTRAGLKAYVNADGVRFAVANDERGVGEIDPQIINLGQKEGEVTVVVCRVAMANGQVYKDFGAVMVDKDWNPANALLKATTKAERRAGYKAIAGRVGLPQYDEDTPEARRADYDADYREVTEAPKSMRTLLNRITDEEVERFVGDPAAPLTAEQIQQVWSNIQEYRRAQAESK